MRALVRRLRWIAFGAALAWVLDPIHGAARRARVRDEAAGLARRAGELTARGGREAAEQLEDVADEIDATSDGSDAAGAAGRDGTTG